MSQVRHRDTIVKAREILESHGEPSPAFMLRLRDCAWNAADKVMRDEARQLASKFTSAMSTPAGWGDSWGCPIH